MINSVAAYRRLLKKNLRCCRRTKKRLLAKFDSTMEAFLAEMPVQDMDALNNAFGPPQEMAQVLMSEVSEKELSRYRITKWAARITALVMVLIWVLFTIHVYFQKSFPVIMIDEGQYLETNSTQSSEEAP